MVRSGAPERGRDSLLGGHIGSPASLVGTHVNAHTHIWRLRASEAARGPRLRQNPTSSTASVAANRSEPF